MNEMSKIKSIKEIFIKLLPLILILNFFVIIFYYLSNTEVKTLRDNLIIIEPIFLSVNFGLIVIFLILNLKDLKGLFKDIKKPTLVLLLFVLFLGFYVRMYVAPRTHRVFFDEDIYLAMGKEVLTERKGCLCNYGDYKGCYDCILMKWPNGYAFTLALSYLFFGVSENTAFNLIVLLSTLSILLVFLIGYLLSKKENVGLYAALLFALIPVYIMWSHTTASEPVFIFFTLLTVFSFIITLKTDTWKAMILAMSCLAFAPQTRTEGVVLLILVSAITILLDRKFILKLNQKKFIIPLIMMLILITPYLLHINLASRTETWGESGERFDFQHLKNNIPTNAWFWIMGYPTIEHPTLFTIFVLIGLLFNFKKEGKIALALGFWFLMFFLMYSSFYAGSVRFGIDVRYALNDYPPFVLLGGYGLFLIHERIKKFLKKDLAAFFALTLLIIIYFIVSFVPSISMPAEKIMEANQARTYHDFVIKEASKLDKNCYILSHTPSIFLVMGEGSLQTWYGSNTNTMKELFNKTDCVIFDDNFWCNLEPYKSSVCKHMFDAYNLTTIASIPTIDGANNYTLYMIGNPFK